MTPFSQPSVFRKTPTKNVLNLSFIIRQTPPPLHPPPIILQTINLEEILTLYLHKYSTSKFNYTRDKHTAKQAEQSTLSNLQTYVCSLLLSLFFVLLCVTGMNQSMTGYWLFGQYDVQSTCTAVLFTWISAWSIFNKTVHPFKFIITNFGKSVTEHSLLTNIKMESAANTFMVGQMKMFHSMKTLFYIRVTVHHNRFLF